MPVFLLTIGNALAAFGKWLWNLPTWAKAMLGIALLASIIFCYMAWQRHKIETLEDKLNQSEVNGAMIEVNVLTNQIEERKRDDVNLSKNTNLAERDSADIANRDSSTFTGEASYERFCRRYCRDSRCERYRLVHECR